MGNYRHTGVSDGTARTDYAALGQTQNGAFLWGGTAGGTANAPTISLNPPLAAYAAGQAFRFQTGAAANTSAVTLNVNSIGAVAVNKGDGTLALGASDLPASAMVTVVHDGTRFRLIDVASDAPWVDLASATTTDLSTVGANVRITGTTTITGFGTAPSGTTRKLRFAAALTLTHNSTSLILPGAANITTAAGDTAEAISLGSANWVVVQYTRAASLGINRGTAQAATSGTAIDFTGIPSGARRVTLMFDDVSVSGLARVLVQLGSGSVQTTGYLGSSASVFGTNQCFPITSTSGFILERASAGSFRMGAMTFVNISGNKWVQSHSIGDSAGTAMFGGGVVTLSGALDRLRVTTDGADTFDNGSVNIIWEF
jgi:hypothetical protein